MAGRAVIAGVVVGAGAVGALDCVGNVLAPHQVGRVAIGSYVAVHAAISRIRFAVCRFLRGAADRGTANLHAWPHDLRLVRCAFGGSERVAVLRYRPLLTLARALTIFIGTRSTRDEGYRFAGDLSASR